MLAFIYVVMFLIVFAETFDSRDPAKTGITGVVAGAVWPLLVAYLAFLIIVQAFLACKLLVETRKLK